MEGEEFQVKVVEKIKTYISCGDFSHINYAIYKKIQHN